MVVVPPEVRAALVAHANEEDPNEACGLVVLKDGIAERYERGRNGAASPYRFELEVAPELWFLEDDGYELAVFHSHLSVPAPAVAHGRREHRPLGGQAVPHLLGARGRPRRLDDPGRRDRPARSERVGKPYFVTLNVPFMPAEAWGSHW